MKKKKLHTRSFTVIVNIGIGSCRFFFILFLKYAPQSVSFSQCLCSDYFMCVCVCARGLGIFASNVSRLWLTLQMYTNTHHTHSTHLFPLHVRAGQEVYFFCSFRYFCCWMQNTSFGEKKNSTNIQALICIKKNMASKWTKCSRFFNNINKSSHAIHQNLKKVWKKSTHIQSWLMHTRYWESKREKREQIYKILAMQQPRLSSRCALILHIFSPDKIHTFNYKHKYTHRSHRRWTVAIRRIMKSARFFVINIKSCSLCTIVWCQMCVFDRLIVLFCSFIFYTLAIHSPKLDNIRIGHKNYKFKTKQ